MFPTRRFYLIIALLLVCTGTGWGKTCDDQGPAYLVYAGPYSTSPSSAFGHLFLVLQPKLDVPLPLWDVVSFSAETHGAGPVRFFFAGITGGFQGTYKTKKFHEQVRDYELLEDRDITMVQLRLSKQEREAIHHYVAENKGTQYPYTFFSRNCAFYLQQLLACVSASVPQPSGAVSPMGVMELIINNGLAEASYFRPAISAQLVELAQRAQDSSVARVQESDWRELASDHEWLNGLPLLDRTFLQRYFHWKTLQTKEPLDKATSAGLAQLRLLNSREISKPEADLDTNAPGKPAPFPEFHGYGKLSLASGLWSDQGRKISLRYRAAQHDVADPWQGYRLVNTLELLAVEISSDADRWHPRLEEFTVFSQRSLVPVNLVTSNASWMLELSAKRGGLFGPSAMHSGIRTGWGRTKRVVGNSYFHGLVTGALLGSVDDGIALAPGVQMGLSALVSDRLRGGLQWDWHKDLFELANSFGEFSAWVRYDLGGNFGTTFKFEANSDRECLEVIFCWYL